MGSNYWDLPDNGSFAIAGIDHDGDGIDAIGVLKLNSGDVNFYLYDAPVGTQSTALIGTDNWTIPDRGAYTVSGLDHDGDGVDSVVVLKNRVDPS